MKEGNIIDIEIRKIPEKKHFYDETTSVAVTARVFLEERVTSDLTERITTSDLYSEKRVNLDNWEYNHNSEKEKKATINIFNLGKKGCNLVVWISPDDGNKAHLEGRYKEGRLNIEFPVYGQDEWSIYGKHFPLLFNNQKTLKLAEKLLDNGGKTVEEINNIDDVRCQPIGFNIKNIDDWINECRKLMPEFEEIWESIENGNDIKNQLKMVRDVVINREKAGDDNCLFEMLMAKMGNEINAEGGHGGSWGGKDMGIIVTVNSNGEFSFSLGSTDNLNYCEHCDCYYSGDKCPLCGIEKVSLLAA